MAVFVSLFRAINVGGNNHVKMDALKQLHEELGLRNVTHYLQTGNVVFESDESDPAQLAGQLAKAFEQRFGFKSEVIIRSADEIKEVFSQNPFINQPEKDPKFILVYFLTGHPGEEAKQALLSSYTGPEEIFVTGKEAFIYYTEGVGRSKLSNTLIEKRLKVSGTGRNWNTVSKLLEMTRR